MATNEEVLADLRRVISDVTGLPVRELDPEKSFIDDLDLDSLAVAEIVVAIDERLSVRIPDEDIERLVTIMDLLTYVVARLE